MTLENAMESNAKLAEVIAQKKRDALVPCESRLSFLGAVPTTEKKDSDLGKTIVLAILAIGTVVAGGRYIQNKVRENRASKYARRLAYKKYGYDVSNEEASEAGIGLNKHKSRL